MSEVWHKIWPSNVNYGTNCNTLDILITEISKIAEEVGLDNVDPMGITEVLESHPFRKSLPATVNCRNL